jgi:hypothetical protein
LPTESFAQIRNFTSGIRQFLNVKMPLFTLRTTVARVPETFFAETASLIGNLLGKPSEV